MSNSDNDGGNNNATEQDLTLSRAHGTVMVIGWIMFASTGILFARYGRLLHIDNRIKILGESIWFHIHRFTLSVTSILTLIGFFLILVQANGQWVNKDDDKRVYTHSILGIIVVCCSQIQLWMVIYRCNANNRYRYIFTWLHRLTGLLAFILSIPTIFLVMFILPEYRIGLITILSLWSIWIIVIVIIFEIIEYRFRRIDLLAIDNRRQYEIDQTDSIENVQIDNSDNLNMQVHNRIKTILFTIHIIITIGLSIPLIILIWLQDDI